jgi:hypothetical protein
MISLFSDIALHVEHAVQGYPRIIGWTMRAVRSATIARVFSQLGGGSIIVAFAVSQGDQSVIRVMT